MSQVRGLLFIGLLPAVLFIAGCGSPNSEVGFDPNTGKHITNWLVVHGSAYTTYNGQCAGCHGNRLDGGISAVNCFSNAACHTTASCGTCHTLPPSGAFFPNTAGKHAGHMSLPNVSFTCDSCHSGAGGGTLLHFDYIVQVSFSGTTYNAKSGTASFNALTKTCSNVSCHGASRTQTSTQAGQAPPTSSPAQTPGWPTGTIDLNTDAGCKACHVLGSSVGLPENNSYYSGQHRRHVYSQRKACTDCHDTVKLAVNHFTTLNTTTMEGPASATLRSDVHYVGANGSGSCSPACHGGESW